LVTDVEDILSELNYLDGLQPAPVGEKPADVAAGRPANLTDAEARVFECFRGGAILAPDALSAQTGLTAAQLSATLMMLELKHLVAKRADGAFEARG
ncbi:MAG: DNA-protecting protein DprA, partial [Verrucomicrobiota bacterium]|nr:DNA-protecting protein DprA [Verrucomicrobiota bacterium]